MGLGNLTGREAAAVREPRRALAVQHMRHGWRYRQGTTATLNYSSQIGLAPIWIGVPEVIVCEAPVRSMYWV
jgi:hypothetical protein